MREFIVEDRNRGVILVRGTIDAQNRPEVDEPSFDLSQLSTILEAISADLAQGFSGGQLPVRGLEWFELPGG